MPLIPDAVVFRNACSIFQPGETLACNRFSDEAAGCQLKGPCAYYPPIEGVHSHSNHSAVLARQISERSPPTFERVYPEKTLPLHQQPALPAC